MAGWTALTRAPGQAAATAIAQTTAQGPSMSPTAVNQIQNAFGSRPDIAQRIIDALRHNPNEISLFSDISDYVTSLTDAIAALEVGKEHGDTSAEPAAKKRKLDAPKATQNGAVKTGRSVWMEGVGKVAYEAKDTSFSVPQRKKLKLEVVKDMGIRAVNQSSGNVEFGVGFSDIEQIFCLPVPEKTTRQHNFVVIPKFGDGITPPPTDTAVPEPIVWTYNEPKPKDLQEGEDPKPVAIAGVIDGQIYKLGRQVVFPDEAEFVSAIKESHRKRDNAYHVKAFRGSKEGYLFLTSVGILFAFKKPLLFFSHAAISSISYTSVLQRTFNLVISVSPTSTSEATDYEFSMLDQADYDGIQTYVAKHELNDASMATERKAKRLNINGVKTEEGEKAEAGDVVMGDGEEETELAKAERELQDLEDEEEEDYDPGSEGDSDGSGSDSEEDEGGDEVEIQDDEEEDVEE